MNICVDLYRGVNHSEVVRGSKEKLSFPDGGKASGRCCGGRQGDEGKGIEAILVPPVCKQVDTQDVDLSLCKASFEACTCVVGQAHVPGDISMFLINSVEKVCDHIRKVDAMCSYINVAMFCLISVSCEGLMVLV